LANRASQLGRLATNIFFNAYRAPMRAMASVVMGEAWIAWMS
jgi:hypothetical protein